MRGDKRFSLSSEDRPDGKYYRVCYQMYTSKDRLSRCTAPKETLTVVANGATAAPAPAITPVVLARCTRSGSSIAAKGFTGKCLFCDGGQESEKLSYSMTKQTGETVRKAAEIRGDEKKSHFSLELLPLKSVITKPIVLSTRVSTNWMQSSPELYGS